MNFRKLVPLEFKKSALADALGLLSTSDRYKLFAVAAIQFLTGFLDLLAVGAIGMLGALTVNGIQSKAPGNKVEQALSFLHIQNLTFQHQVIVIGITAASLMLLRTCFAIFFSRRVLFFLSFRSASISSTVISKLLSKPYLFHQNRLSQETLYLVTTGVSSVMLGVIGTFVNLVADLSGLLILSGGLLILSPGIAFGTIALFSALGIFLYRILHKRAGLLGQSNSDLSIVNNRKILEILGSFREIFVRNRRYHYYSEISEIRFQLARVQAEMQFMPNINKYVVETAVVISGLALCAFQFAIADASHAIATLAVFLAAGTRIAPAILRIQQGVLGIRGSLGTSKSTLILIRELHGGDELLTASENPFFDHSDFIPELIVRNLEFSYPGESKFALKDVNLSINPGSLIAIVGPSGAGKTTFADLILGILEQTSGEILISQTSPATAIRMWPGAIGYVPQDVQINDGTVLENVAMGFNPDRVQRSDVLQALRTAQLEEVVQNLPNGIDTQVGERGSRLSGGQRQRLGIARAVFTRPKLLILDEATSALDAQTEQAIAEAIEKLKGGTTVVTIAHRLSTLRNADQVVYFQDGKILSIGKFEEVRSQVANFDKQIRLLSINSSENLDKE